MEQLTQNEPLIELTLNKDVSPNQTCSFERLFSESVDSAFSILGTQAKELIYRYLANSCELSKEQIPNNIELFSQSIENLFGQSARLIEIRVMKILHEKVPAFSYTQKENSNLSFVNYVQAFQSFV
jgi:hypothetical protein